MPKILSAEDVEAFRERLCDVAEELFAAHGPTGVTMRQLADALGVSAMTPYRYFEDKDAILAAVRARAFNRFADAMEKAQARLRHKGGHQPDPAYLDFALANRAAYRMMFDTDQPTFSEVSAAPRGDGARARDDDGGMEGARDRGALHGAMPSSPDA